VPAAEWVEVTPQLVLVVIQDMATELSPPREPLIALAPETIPILPGAIEESPFG